MPASRAVSSLLAERQQHVFAEILQRRHRHAEHHRRPQADAQCAPHHARLARAVGLRGQRRYRRHHAHAEHEGGKQHDLAERSAGEGIVAEMADQHEIAGHHRDLAELRQRDRQSELDRAFNSSRQRFLAADTITPAVRSRFGFVMAATLACVVARPRPPGDRGHLIQAAWPEGHRSITLPDSADYHGL